MATMDYILRRLILVPVTLALATILTFTLIRLVPGDAIDAQLADVAVTGDILQAISERREELGLNDPPYVALPKYIIRAARGDLGQSMRSQQEVTDILLAALPVTLEVTLLAFLVGSFVGVLGGVLSAAWPDSIPDYTLRSVAVLFLSVPPFVKATFVILVMAIYLRTTPRLGYVGLFDDPVANLKQVALPVLILGLSLSASQLRITRTMMLEVLHQDYIRTAYGKGLTQRTVLMRHALRNALLPVITFSGLQLSQLVSGSVIVETLFGLPGLGQQMITAIDGRDYSVIQGIVLCVTAFIVVINLSIDILYGVIDPRIRISRETGGN
jgi:peptide/nickel transport system permease protein